MSRQLRDAHHHLRGCVRAECLLMGGLLEEVDRRQSRQSGGSSPHRSRRRVKATAAT